MCMNVQNLRKFYKKHYNDSQFIQGSTFIHEFLALIISKYVVVVVIVVGCQVIIHHRQIVRGHCWVVIRSSGCCRSSSGHHQLLSGHCQLLSGHCQLLLGHHQLLSGHHWLLSVVVGCCQSSSVVVSCCQSLSVVVSCCWLSSVIVSRRQSSSVIISHCQSLSAVIGGHQIVVGSSSVIVSHRQLSLFIIGCRWVRHPSSLGCCPSSSGCHPSSSVVVKSSSVIIALVSRYQLSSGMSSMILLWVVVGLCPSSSRHHGSLSRCHGLSHHCQLLSRHHQSSLSIIVSCRRSSYIVIRSWVVVRSLSVLLLLLSGHRPGWVIMAMVSHSMVVSHRSSLFEKRNYKMGTYPRSLWTVNHHCQLSSLKLVRKGARPGGHHCQRRLQGGRCAMGSCNLHGGPASWRGFRGRCANEDSADTEVSVATRSKGIQRSVHHTIEPSKFPGRI